MSMLKLRAGLLGLLAMLLVGSFAAASAEAAGPFWYHRAKGETGKGVKLSGQEPEEVRGGGPEVILSGKLIETPVEITSRQIQVKGIIYNNALQGQAKLELAYSQPKLIKPAFKECLVVIGSKNVVKVYGHQAWTWNGEPKQLEEQKQEAQKPDWIFLGQELQQGATSLPKGVPFTNITMQSAPGEKCPLAGQFEVTGSVAASITPESAGTFSTEQTQTVLANGALQHFWNGKENIGVKTELVFGGVAATLKQKTTTSTFGRQGGAPQEVALFES